MANIKVFLWYADNEDADADADDTQVMTITRFFLEKLT